MCDFTTIHRNKANGPSPINLPVSHKSRLLLNLWRSLSVKPLPVNATVLYIVLQSDQSTYLVCIKPKLDYLFTMLLKYNYSITHTFISIGYGPSYTPISYYKRIVLQNVSREQKCVKRHCTHSKI